MTIIYVAMWQGWYSVNNYTVTALLLIETLFVLVVIRQEIKYIGAKIEYY